MVWSSGPPPAAGQGQTDGILAREILGTGPFHGKDAQIQPSPAEGRIIGGHQNPARPQRAAVVLQLHPGSKGRILRVGTGFPSVIPAERLRTQQRKSVWGDTVHAKSKIRHGAVCELIPGMAAPVGAAPALPFDISAWNPQKPHDCHSQGGNGLADAAAVPEETAHLVAVCAPIVVTKPPVHILLKDADDRSGVRGAAQPRAELQRCLRCQGEGSVSLLRGAEESICNVNEGSTGPCADGAMHFEGVQLGQRKGAVVYGPGDKAVELFRPQIPHADQPDFIVSGKTLLSQPDGLLQPVQPSGTEAQHFTHRLPRCSAGARCSATPRFYPVPGRRCPGGTGG